MEDIFEFRVKGNTVCLRFLTPRLDAAAVGSFKERLSLVWQNSINAAEIDMSAVEFVDSSGIGALLSIYRRLPAGAETVTLHGLRPQVQAVIDLLRLHRVFRCEP